MLSTGEGRATDPSNTQCVFCNPAGSSSVYRAHNRSYDGSMTIWRAQGVGGGFLDIQSVSSLLSRFGERDLVIIIALVLAAVGVGVATTHWPYALSVGFAVVIGIAAWTRIVFALGVKGLISFLIVAVLSTSLYGIYLSPPTMPQLMLYRLLQPVVLAGIIVSARIRHSRADLAVLVLTGYSVIVMAIQAVGSSEPLADVKALYYMVSSLFLTYSAAALRGSYSGTRAVLGCGMLCFWAANVLVGMVEVLTGLHLPYSDPSSYTQTLKHVPLGFFFNQNDFAAMLAILTPYGLFWRSNKARLAVRLTRLGALTVTVYLLVRAASISAMVSFLIAVFLWLVMDRKNRWAIVTVAIGLGILICLLYTDAFGALDLPLVAKISSRIGQPGGLIGEVRASTYALALRLIWENPLGVRPSFTQAVLPTNPHSLWLEVSLHLGWLGLILFGYCYVLLISRSYRAIGTSNSPWWSYLSRSTFVALIVGIVAVNGPSRVFSGFNVLWVVFGLALTLPVEASSSGS